MRYWKHATAFALAGGLFMACSDGTTTPTEMEDTPITPEIGVLAYLGFADGPDVDPILSTETRNQTCSQLIGVEGIEEFKLDQNDIQNTSFTSPDGLLTVTFSNYDGKSYDFVANRGIDAVYNKAGKAGSFLYWYFEEGNPDRPAKGGVKVDPFLAWEDDGLTTPEESGNNISHVSFCYTLRPGVEITKDGDELSKIGDDVTYSFRITNTGDYALTLTSLTDDVLGDLAAAATTAGCDVLDLGETCAFDYDWTVPEGAADPTVNIVTAVYDSEGGQATASDDHSLNLFQPSIRFDKTGDKFSKIGDAASYTLTLNNTSSGDSPSLECTITDALIGVSESVTLASGEAHVVNASYTIQEGDADPFINTATASCSPIGFPNVLEASDSWETDLVQPSFDLAKICLVDPVPYGEDAQFRVTFKNTGTADLVVGISDPLVPSIDGTYNVAIGETLTLDGTATPGVGALDITNVVDAAVTLDPIYGLSNSYTGQETVTCQVEPPPMNDETAWAANDMDPGSLLFNPDGGNWATYVQYTGEKMVGFFAGKDQPVGTVHFSAVGKNTPDMVTITIHLDGAAFDPDSYIAIELSDDPMEGQSTAPGGFTHQLTMAEVTGEGFHIDPKRYYAVHGVVLVPEE